MKVVVGLGNPGPEYDGTRHNVGFAAIDRLGDKFHFSPSRSWKKGDVRKGAIGSHDVLLVKPLTFMNLSGDCVGPILQYYKVAPEDLIVIHDELDFPAGTVRVKVGGGHGGHNGLRSLASHVGREFVRIRMGIGKPPPKWRGADYVLSRFEKSVVPHIEEALECVVQAVELVVSDGPQAAMQQYNTRAT